MTEKVTNIGGRLHDTSSKHTVTGANEILDDDLQKKQSVINAEQQEFNQEQEGINADTYRKNEAYNKEQVNNLISRTPETDVVVLDSAGGYITTDIYPHESSAWESGTLNPDGPIASDARCRTVDYIDITKAVSFDISQISGETPLDVSIYFFTEEKVYIEETPWKSSGSILTPSDAKYIKLVVRLHDNPSGNITTTEAAAGAKCEKNVPTGLDDVPMEDRPNKLFRVPGPTNQTFSEWGWDGTEWVMLANKDYGIDDEPLGGSDNMAKSGGISSRLMNGLFVGKGDTYVNSGKIIGLKSGNRYRITLQDPRYARDEITLESGVLFRISSFYNNTETVLESFDLPTTLKDFYDFEVPLHSDYIIIGGRANNGLKVRFTINDISYIEEIVKLTSDSIDDCTKIIDKLANDEKYVYNIDLSAFVGKPVAAEDIKIPLSIKAGSLVRFKYESNDILTILRLYVKYVGSAERTQIFTEYDNYVQSGNVLQFVAADDIEYMTFLSTEYTITSQTYMVFTFETGLSLTKNNINYNSDYMWDIYESITDNILDTTNVVNGVSIDNVTCEVTFDPRGVISRPIFAEDKVGQKLTISGHPAEAKRAIYFFKDSVLSKDSIVDWYNFTDNQRTVTIPNRTRYIIVCLRNKDYDYQLGTLVDYSNLKLAFGENAATQSYSGKYLFNAKMYDSFFFSSLTQNILNTSNVFSDLRLTDVPPYFVQDQYGIVTCDATYIKGATELTFRNTSAFDTGSKWIVFTTDRSRTEASVVGINFIPINPGGSTQVVSVPVPANAVWMYVTLRVSGEDMQTAKTMTCAVGISPTTDAYEKCISSIMDIPLASQAGNGGGSDTDEYDEVVKHESLDTWKRYLPFSVGAPVTQEGIAPFTGQYQRAHILFFTDNHIDLLTPAASLRNVQDAVGFANNGKVIFDALINAGDAITPFGEVSKTGLNGAEARLTTFFNECKKSDAPFLFAKGNHDSNDWDNIPANALGDDDWSSLIYNYMESECGFVRQTKGNGKKSSYGYYDITSHKIRVIVIDAQDIDRTPVNGSGHCKYYGGNAWHISDEQFRWIADTALSFNENGWYVIPVIHQLFYQSGTWYTVEGMPSSIQKLFNMFAAFNNHTTYTQEAYTYSPDSFYNLTAFTKDFSFSNLTDKPGVICWLVGHEHFDRYQQVNGMNIVWTLNGSANTESSDQRVPKVIGTSTQNAFDVMSIDTRLHKVRFVRFGAGVNCYGVGGDRFLPNGLSY